MSCGKFRENVAQRDIMKSFLHLCISLTLRIRVAIRHPLLEMRMPRFGRPNSYGPFFFSISTVFEVKILKTSSKRNRSRFLASFH